MSFIVTCLFMSMMYLITLTLPLLYRVSLSLLLTPFLAPTSSPSTSKKKLFMPSLQKKYDNPPHVVPILVHVHVLLKWAPRFIYCHFSLQGNASVFFKSMIFQNLNIYIVILLFMTLFLLVGAHGRGQHTPATPCMQVRGQHAGVSALLPWGSWGSNSAHQAWQQVSLPTEPYC